MFIRGEKLAKIISVQLPGSLDSRARFKGKAAGLFRVQTRGETAPDLYATGLSFTP